MADVFAEFESFFGDREYKAENDTSNEYEALASWWWEVYREFKGKFGKRRSITVFNDSMKKAVEAANRYCSKKFDQFTKALKALEDNSYEAAKQSEIEREREEGEDIPDEDKYDPDHELVGEYYQEYLKDIVDGAYDNEFKRISDSLKASSRSSTSFEWRDDGELSYKTRRWSQQLDLLEGFMSDYAANCQKEIALNKLYIMEMIFEEEDFEQHRWQDIETQFGEPR